MEFYGPYQVVKDFASGPDSTVYLASDNERPGELFAIKVRRPRDLNPLSPSTHPAIVDFRLAAEKQAALAKAPGLVRIELSGVDARGAWCARKFYRHSLRWVIAGRAHMRLEDIYFLVQSVVRALVELRRVSGSPHGNLHPGNVLIQPTATFRESEVALTDIASPTADVNSAARSDLRAVGLIIYQLVRARSLEQVTGATNPVSWPIPKTEEEWSALFGKQADGWRALCNTLLDRELDLARTNLESVASEVEALAPPPSRVARCGQLVAHSARVSVPAALLLLVCLYLHWVPDSRSPPWLQRSARWVGNPRILPGEWHDCRTEYFAWFSNFLMAAESAPARWTDDNYLNGQVLMPIENASSNLLTQANLSLLAGPGDDVAGTRAKLAAWKSIRSLANSTRGQLEGWPARTNLVAVARRFRLRQWDGPANELAARAEAVRYSSDSNWRVVIQAVLEADTRLREMDVENVWREVEESAKHIQKVFPELVEVSRLLEDRVEFSSTGADLEELGKRLQKRRELAREASDFVTEVWKQLPKPLKDTNLPPKGLALLSWGNWKQIVQDVLLRHQQSPENLAAIKEFKARRFPADPMLEKEWLTRVDSLAMDPDRREGLSNSLERLHGFFVHLTNFLATPAFSMAATDQKIGSIAQRIAQEQRERALLGILNLVTNQWQGNLPPIEQDDTTKMWAEPVLLALKDRFNDLQAALKEFSGEAPNVHTLLETGDHVEALHVWRRWKGGAMFGDLENERGLQTMFEPLRELEEIEDRRDLGPKALVARVLSATRETPLALPWAAWKRLGAVSATWPTDLAQMTNEAQMQRVLQERVSRMDATVPPRRAELQNQLERAAVDLFLAGFIVLTNDTTRAEARQLFKNEGLTNMFERLPPEARYNSRLLDLRLMNLSAENSNTVSQLHAEFVTRVHEWDLASRIAGFSNIEALSFTNWARAPDVPASILQARTNWARKEGEREVTFTWSTQKLRFFRVQPSGSKPFYLCDTEVPVGLVADWAAKVIGDAKLANSGWPPKRPHDGIQTWERGDSRRPIKVAKSWFDKSSFYIGTNRQEVTNVPAPASSHPINYVPAHVARYLAESMGFRLPTPAEWLQAYLSQPDTPAIANLRDATWQRQKAYIAMIKPVANPAGTKADPWPDKGVFKPKGFEIPEEARAIDNRLDDGVLWFAPAQEAAPARGSDSSQRFLHLVGNVAEFACEVTSEKTNYFVLGGSALSDPRLSVTNAYPLTNYYKYYNYTDGYSDVGFRLALDGEESPVQRFITLVHSLNYLGRRASDARPEKRISSR